MDAKRRALFRDLEKFYVDEKRSMPWREPEPNGKFDPYKILVSEIMLQQTQVDRVIPKFQQFITKFPSIRTLANAPLSDVLSQWNGLGYSRRAKYLHDAAKFLKDKAFPRHSEELTLLKGVGTNTAAAIIVYSFNKPEVFIETNIRSVLFHSFFQDRKNEKISDNELLNLLTELLDKENPREFYWAIMDFGAYLKKNGQARLSQSKHYRKQSAFKGSTRQLRGKLLRAALGEEMLASLKDRLRDDRIDVVIKQMTKEKMIYLEGEQLKIVP